jgi:hypothetical protein
MKGQMGIDIGFPISRWRSPLNDGIYSSDLFVRRDWDFGDAASGISDKVPLPVTVGTVIANRPPCRSVRAGLPHTAPTLDGWRRNARQGKDAGREDEGSIVRRLGGCVSNSAGCAGYDAQAASATDCRDSVIAVMRN